MSCILTTLLWFSTAFGVQLSTSAIYEQTAPATVLIRTDMGAGSGFVVKPDGVIVTSWHVVRDATQVEIRTESGEVYDQVYLLAKDERKDIAILKIPAFDIPVVTLGNSNEVTPGTPIIVIGNPLGIEKLRTTVTNGIVSGIRFSEKGHQVIQISAPISPGNSGGPVISDKGEVVGVAAFQILGGEHLNFAIPINYVRGLLGMDLSQPLSKWEKSDKKRRSGESSSCHVFIDIQNIWTIEIIVDRRGAIVPILNIITFSPGEWDFRPRDIHLYSGDQESRAERFSMDTGVPDEPYLMEYLRVLGNSFLGLDLLGKFDDFLEPTEVVIDLGEDRFQLEPLECMDYEALAGKLDQINFNSPNLWEDFDVLQIEFMGHKMPSPNRPYIPF